MNKPLRGEYRGPIGRAVHPIKPFKQECTGPRWKFDQGGDAIGDEVAVRLRLVIFYNTPPGENIYYKPNQNPNPTLATLPTSGGAHF